MLKMMASLMTLLLLFGPATVPPRVLAAVPIGQAEQAPNFSGTWTLVAEPAAAGRGPVPRIPATAGSGWGQEFSIAQDARLLTIERAQFSAYDMQPPMRLDFVLDGSESRNVVNIGRGRQVQTSNAVWTGTSLTITTRHGVGTPLAAHVRQVFTVDASAILTIETTRVAGDSSTPSTTVARYRRVQPVR
jgi:hypothetical protein